MKNLKSFPFERNRYFYGKLLSVEDFETEQRYFNDKRRTINRFLFGSGVVCGLGVVEVDDESISVERGLALDFAGREIVLDEPAVRKITELEGYGGEEEADFYYLCLEYQEEAVELMHNVTGTMGRNSSEYNKYKEGYRMFVTQKEPEREVFSPFRLFEDRRIVYQGQGIKICQILPKFLNPGKDFSLWIEVEYAGQQKFSFEYELELSFLTNGDGNRIHISFQEEGAEKRGKNRIEIPLKAACVNDVKAEASLVKNSFRLLMGGREYGNGAACVSQSFISDRDVYDSLQAEYYKTAMDYIMSNNFQQGIYLAKIYVVRAGSVCLIDRIEPLPFDQKIMHTEISTALLEKLVEDVKILKQAKLLETESRKEQEEKRPLKAAYGDVVFEVERIQSGEILYSDEIVHGLGFAPVTIELGYEVCDEFSKTSKLVFGDASLFQDHYGFECALGARSDPSKGTFEIALKIIKNKGAKRVRVYWTAVRNNVSRSEAARKKRIYIQPDNPDVYTGDSITFTVVLEGFIDDRLQWTVRDRDGGIIDKNGRYTAPEMPGIFQIMVSSMAYPEVQATTFVIVREKEKDRYGD